MKQMDVWAVVWHQVARWPWEVWPILGLAIAVRAYELVRPRRRRRYR